MKIENMIYIYLAICVAMIIFNIVCIFVLRAKDKSLTMNSEKLSLEIETQLLRLRDGEEIESSHYKYLYNKLKTTSNLMAFDECIMPYYIYEANIVIKYFEETHGVFVSLMDTYVKKSDIEVAYFPYIIRKYRILHHDADNQILNTLFCLIPSKDVYCRENTLKAIYSSGNEQAVAKALHILDRSKIFHHPKLISNGLLNFQGNHHKLAKLLFDEFDQFSINYKTIILNYILYDGDEYTQSCLDLLEDPSSNDEVKLACIRYLGKYPYEKAYPTILEYAKNSNGRWEYQVVATSALLKYKNDEAIQVLKDALKSPNWHVRYNAAATLDGYQLSYEEMIDIFDGDDRYAREMLQYRMDKRNAALGGVGI